MNCKLMSPSSLLLFVALLGSRLVAAQLVLIQAGKSFCVFEDLKASTPWGVQFQSDEHPVTAILRSPGKVLHRSEKPELYGSYSIITEMEGRYSVCFENPSSTIQKVAFSFLGPNAAIPAADKLDPIDQEIQSLTNGLRSVQTEQDNMIRRAQVHHKISEKTNSRVRYWFTYQLLLVTAVTGFEVYYLKSFFEKRRVV